VISAGQTDKGHVRKGNEDAFLDAPQRGLWAVADGMGGHSAGDVASKMIVERLAGLPGFDSAADYVDAVDAVLEKSTVTCCNSRASARCR